MENFLAIIIGAVFVNNFILTRFLGLCPFFGVSNKTKNALGMGLAVTFVTAVSSLLTWLLYNLALVKFHLEFLKILTFILVIATFVQLVEIFIKKYSPTLYKAFGIYLPLITTNCIILGVTFLNIDLGYTIIGSVVFGISVGIGFTLVLLLMSGIRERLELAEVPKAFKGLPIAFITATLMSLAFFAFSGMIK